MNYYVLGSEPCLRPRLATDGKKHLEWKSVKDIMIRCYAEHLKTWKNISEEEYLDSDIVTKISNTEFKT